MDHPLHVDVDNPWRTRAFAAAGIALLELVILLSIGTAIFGRSVAHTMRGAAEAKVLAPTTAAPAKAKPAAAKPVAKKPVVTKRAVPPPPPRERTSVLVLNGNGRTGAAADEAAVVRSIGYTIAGVGDAPNHEYARTVVMYRPSFRREALRLAHDLHGVAVSPLDGIAASTLMGAQLAIVLGAS